MYVPFALCYYFQAFWLLSVPVEMSVEMEHAHPMQISIRGFDASDLLQCSTNWFSLLNGKQPIKPLKFVMCMLYSVLLFVFLFMSLFVCFAFFSFYPGIIKLSIKCTEVLL